MREVAQGKTSFQVNFELTNNLVQGRVNQYHLEEVKSSPVVKVVLSSQSDFLTETFCQARQERTPSTPRVT